MISSVFGNLPDGGTARNRGAARGDDGGTALYLKRLEMVGFKSFAERTKLEYEPGIMAIVGPNGCGKSNISDAIRWVLGEQSAKSLRGAGMTDFIFNGTDTHKPMGMAEVSLTLAECEASLGMEYHEVTVTRRVYRSGEGEYLINKTPCRLKDIQRLFMDTGVGTNSYSLMEQGRIDRILSSHPEDRREVFEEASGITKFKADRREAMRKLDQTEANLLRLADIIREVKRQIISLQRQAGKARRFQVLQQELRGLDLHFTRGRVEAIEAELATLEARRAALAEREEAMTATVREVEASIDTQRTRLTELDRDIEETREFAAQAKAEWQRTQEAIAHNEDRVREYRQLSDNYLQEQEAGRKHLEDHRQTLAALQADLETAAAARQAAEADLQSKAARLREQEQALDGAAQQLHRMRTELVEIENRVAGLTNDLSECEAREKGTMIRRERLLVEQSQYRQALAAIEAQRNTLAAKIAGQRAAFTEADRRVQELQNLVRDRAAAVAALRQKMSELKPRDAALAAQIDLLARQEAKSEGFPGGARLILDGTVTANGAALLGALATHLEAEPEYRTCLEAVLRPWADALVVSTADGAVALLRELDRRRAGAARLLAVDAAARPDLPPAGDGEDPLLAHVRCADAVRNVVTRLLGGVRVVGDLARVAPPAPGVTHVTPSGMLAGGGAYEIWMTEAADSSNPVARRQRLQKWRDERETVTREMAATEADLARLQADDGSIDAQRSEARRTLEVARTAVAMSEGESGVLAREDLTARQRAETVSMEIESLSGQDEAARERRERIHTALDEARARQGEVRQLVAVRTDEQRVLEQQRAQWMQEVTEARISAADRRREVEALQQRAAAHEDRIRELESLVRERADGVVAYHHRIEELLRTTAASRDSLQPLEEEAALHQNRFDALRRDREAQARILESAEHKVRTERDALDEAREARNRIDIELAEFRMRRQTLVERVCADYRVTAEDILAAPVPDWGETGAPADADTLEARIAELRAKIESMGPVNLVAIEEYQELEKRNEFLAAQQEDLVQSKQQLLDMIKKINQTTTQMFQETFVKVNENFKDMFGKLFGGGTARLVMVDEGDVLESGIEIIARPPGKKLQSVSLLSGGERTMTAVALLFSLYMVKPSPFCVLDELDAALDDSNIGRFVTVVKEFLANSQFIVITHNRQTIGAANVLYGVTMEKRGVSKIISVKFNRHQAPPGKAAPAAAPPAAEPEPPASPADAPAAPATEAGAVGETAPDGSATATAVEDPPAGP
ncbi:MAG: chromosome segregation protein SMC [Lentisphaerae bacterium]|nr:chromosome segregation protein SMC [Lentisphaerota bacterium]